MSTIVGDILQIRDCQTLFNKQLCNVFYYIVAVWTGNSDLSDVLDAYAGAVLVPMLAIQRPELVHINLRVDNVTNGVDFADEGVAAAGTETLSAPAPSYVAAGFRLNRSTKITRPGFKRIGGVDEGYITDNEYASTVPQVLAFAAALEANVSVDTPSPGDGILEPVIVGRDALGHLDLNRVNPVVSASPITTIRSQVSRRA